MDLYHSLQTDAALFGSMKAPRVDIFKEDKPSDKGFVPHSSMRPNVAAAWNQA